MRLGNSELPVTLTGAICWVKNGRGLAEHVKEEPAPSLGPLPVTFRREPGTFCAAPREARLPPRAAERWRLRYDVCAHPVPWLAHRPL